MSSLPSSPRSPQSTDISSLLSGALPQGTGEPGSSALLGQRLVQAGHLTQGQLTQALREQQQNRLRLGEICLEHNWLSPEILYSELSSQAVMLGELLIAAQDITFDQLRVALAQQRRFGRHLGEILVWKGWVSPARLEQVLEIQQQLRESPPFPAWEAMQALAADPNGGEMNLVEEEEPEEPSDLSTEQPQSEVEVPFADPVVAESEESLEVLAEVFPELAQTGRAEELGTELEEDPAWLAAPEPADPQQQRIAELERQLRQRDQEWEGLVAEMNQQIESFQQQYQSRIAKLEAKLREQQAQLRQVQQSETAILPDPEERQQLQAELQTTQEQLQTAQHQHQQQQAEWQDQSQALQQEIDRYRHQAQAAQQELQEHLSQAEADPHRQQELTQQIESLRQQADQLQADLTAAQTSATEHRTRSEQLQQEVERLQSQLPQAQQHLQEAQQRIQTLEVENRQAQATLADLNDQLEQEHTRSAQESHSTQQVEELQHQIQDLQQAHQHYEILVEKQQTQLEASQANIQQLTQELATARNQAQEANVTLQSQQSQADQARQHLATLQIQIAQVEHQNSTLAQELQHSQTLLETYRQRLAGLETPQQPATAPSANSTPTDPSPSPGSESARATSPPDPPTRTPPGGTVMPVLTPWAQNLFFQLQEAGLLSDAQMDQVLITWQQRGGKLTQVLSDCTGLTAKTVGFFSDGGYSARVSGSERIGEFLKAADLVTEEQIQQVLKQRPSDQPLVQALVDQGLLHPVTADYFIRHFVQSN